MKLNLHDNDNNYKTNVNNIRYKHDRPGTDMKTHK